VSATHKLNTPALEGSMRAQVLRMVRVVGRYCFDGSQRVEVEILTGPEKGRVVRGLGVGNLRHKRTGEFLNGAQQAAA
jgi:ribosomal protein S28E/S33